jgi:HrpA-like RNA helicase
MLFLGLEELILQILALDLGEPYEFLGQAVTPPAPKSIKNALIHLASLNAVTIDSSISSDDLVEDVIESDLTPLGYHLAMLPVSPKIGKLMLYGVLLRCLDPVLTIAAISCGKNIFISSFDDQGRSDAAKQAFLTGESDLLTSWNVYDSWRSNFTSLSVIEKSARSMDVYCSENFLSKNNLLQIQQMRGQFLELLKEIGFVISAVK